MSWAKLDDQYPDHPKIVEVGPLGLALHVAAMCYCARYLTDGFVPASMIGRLVNFEGINNADNNAVTNKEITDRLTRAGLLEIVPGGYQVHDYLEYNPSGEQVKAERAKNKARQDKFKNHNAVINAVNNTAPSPSPSHIESNIVVVDEPAIWADDPTINGKPAATTTFASESIARSLLMKIAKVAFIPETQREKIEAVHSMIDVYGLEKTETALDAAFQKWVTTKKKNGGGTYSPLNFGWVEKAQESLLEIEKPADDYYAGWELH